jgi:outer membrane protein assembly factor BamB
VVRISESFQPSRFLSEHAKIVCVGACSVTAQTNRTRTQLRQKTGITHVDLKLTLLAAVQLATFCLSPSASGEEWNRFRGPNGSGVSSVTTIPTEWTDSDYNWNIELPGKGHASPVSWGSRVFVTSADDKKKTRTIQCLNVTDGAELWRKDISFAPYKQQKNNSFASSTPAADADHVYALWHSKVSSPLIAYNHTGEKVWEYDLGSYLHGQGGATSPIVYNDVVVVANDHKNDSFLLAVDRLTGKERWKIPREGKRACYGTPCVNTPKNRPAEIIFSHCYEGIIGVDPKTGHQNWHIDVFGRASQRALGSPVIAGDLVVASSGGVTGERQVVVVNPQLAGDEVKVEEVYRVVRQAPHVPTPLVYKDWMFLWSDTGIATCVERGSGNVVWQKRVGGNFYSSPVCIDGRIYCIDLAGEVVVIAASDEYKLMARNPLEQSTRATPAVSNGSLLIRTESRLISIGGE